MSGRARLALAGGIALSLAGCGSTSALKRPQGMANPPAPYGARTAPTDADRLRASPQARPQRSEEVLTSSHPRASDDFDLPPR